jgi:hypothetical protein
MPWNIILHDEFAYTQLPSSGDNLIGQLPWEFMGSGSGPGASSTTGVWPNVGLLDIYTGGTQGNTAGIGLGGRYNGQGVYGVFAATQTGWEEEWIVKQPYYLNNARLRIGTVETTNGVDCLASQIDSILAHCDGLWVRGDVHAPAQASIASNGITISGNVATVTTGSAHGMDLVGQSVTIASSSGCSPTMNGTWVVASIPGTTTYTFPVSAGNQTCGGSSATSTPVADTTWKFEAKSGDASPASTVVDTSVPIDVGYYHRSRIRSLTAGTILFTLYGQYPITSNGITRSAGGTVTVTTAANNYGFVTGSAWIAGATGCATPVNTTPVTPWTIATSSTTTFTFSQAGATETCGGSNAYVVVQQTAETGISTNIPTTALGPFVQDGSNLGTSVDLLIDYFLFAASGVMR